MKNFSWDARIQRAADLIPIYPFAGEALKFYSRIAVFQRAGLFSERAIERNILKG